MLWIGASLVAALLTSAAATHAVPVPPGLAERAEREGRVPVIVRLDAPAKWGQETASARATRRAAVARAADRALAAIGGPARPDLRRYEALPLLALEASPRDLAELAASETVLSIEEDRRNWPDLAQSGLLVGATVSSAAGLRGDGSAIAIVDTGVESTHPFFAGRVVAQACFSFGRDCPNGQKTDFGPNAGEPCTYAPLCWHGTHVAGISAGEGPSYDGVAPAAEVIAIQVSSETMCGVPPTPCVTLYDSDAIAALDYIADTLAPSFPIASVNMSFGGDIAYNNEALCDSQNSSFKQAIDALRALGIASVAAAGNDSNPNGIDSPACISSAVAVGATTDTTDVVWVGSNADELLELWAPGTNITSSMLGGNFSTQTGTSMATPHVAGAFAVLRQADPAASVSTLEAALEDTGVPVTDTRNGLTRPRIQVDDAARSLAPAQCFDGLDNDGDGPVDVDGDGGVGDPDCVNGLDASEAPASTGGSAGGCGIGPELALLVPLLATLARRRNRNAA